jgi:hypothetical protein
MRIISSDDNEDDEVLAAEVSDQLRDAGLEDDEVEFQIECMKDQGMFRVQ